jgi:hypothetical protein
MAERITQRRKRYGRKDNAENERYMAERTGNKSTQNRRELREIGTSMDPETTKFLFSY